MDTGLFYYPSPFQPLYRKIKPLSPVSPPLCKPHVEVAKGIDAISLLFPPVNETTRLLALMKIAIL
jgi:hypothetical protein